MPSESELPEGLSKAIHDMSANTLFMTPSVARLIEPATVPSMQTILLAGEAPSEEDFTRWIDPKQPDRQILHGYGPTEASVLCTMNQGPADLIHTSIGNGVKELVHLQEGVI